MSNMLQRLARELLGRCLTWQCRRFALALCTYELYVQWRMETGLVPGQGSRLAPSLWEVLSPRRKVYLCFSSFSGCCLVFLGVVGLGAISSAPSAHAGGAGCWEASSGFVSTGDSSAPSQLFLLSFFS